MVRKEELTELERQWVEEAFNDGTGYIDNTYVDMRPNVERGVISSLIKKGIVCSDYDPSRAMAFGIACDLYPGDGYTEWF